MPQWNSQRASGRRAAEGLAKHVPTGDPSMNFRTLSFAAAAAGSLAFVGCGGSDDDFSVPPAEQLRTACPGLGGQTVAASAIGLPSGNATIASATFVPAAAQ